VTPAEIFALADKHIASIPAQPAPEPVTTKEPEQKGERRIVVQKEAAQTPMLAMAWHSASAAERETRVMQVLLTVLAAGDSSRLHQRLVERDQLAVSVGSFLHQGFDPGLTWLFAVLPPGGDLAKAEAAIDEEVARLAKEGPTAAELSKARNLALAGFWRGLQTISGKAQSLGTYEVFHGDYRKLFDAPGELESITAEDVKAAATKVMTRDNRTLGTLVPVAAK
jgi:zinc protease